MKKLLATIPVMLLALTLTTGVCKADVVSSLYAWWPLDWATVQQNVADMSGNRNTGYFKAIATTTAVGAGVVNQAITLNGTTQYITLATSSYPIIFSMSRAFTVSLWVKSSATCGGGNIAIFSEGASGGLAAFRLGCITSAGNKMAVTVRNDAGTLLVNTSSATTVYDGKWHSIIFTQDASGNANLYIDGKLDATAFSYTPSGTFTSNNAFIGASNFNGGTVISQLYKGTVDDVRLYARLISNTDIITLYQTSLYNHLNSRGY